MTGCDKARVRPDDAKDVALAMNAPALLRPHSFSIGGFGLAFLCLFRGSENRLRRLEPWVAGAFVVVGCSLLDAREAVGGGDPDLK